MATIIKSVSFQNFYNYYGSFADNTYHFKEGINIVNADNNMGKSKFYNGILWILNNAVYDSDLKKIISDTSSIKLDSKYFNKMASGKALILNQNFDMGVNITFIDNNDKYSVSKIVQFKKISSNWETNEVLEIIQTIDNKDIPVLDTTDKDKIIKKIIPKELMDYALLQGESMEKLVDLSSPSGLYSTIKTLAGINNLIEICEISKGLTIKTKKLVNDKELEINSNDDRVETLVEQRVEIEGRIENTEKQIEIYKTELSEAKKKKDILEAILLNAKNREKFRSMVKAFENEIKRLKDKKYDREKNITLMLFSENSPWILMGLKEHISQFDFHRINLSGEIATQKAINHPFTKLPVNSPDAISLKRMIDNCICEICGRPAPKDSESWNHMNKIYKRPDNNSNKNNFSSFYGEIQNRVGSFSLSIPKISENIQDYRDEIDRLDELISQKEEERESAKSEFLNAGGSELILDNNDKQSISDYSLAEKTKDEKEKDIQKAEKTIRDLNIRLKQIENEINEIGSNEEIENYRKFKDTMEYVKDILFNTKERVFDEILKYLEINANQKYEELTHGNLSSGGRLVFNRQTDGTVQISIKNINDGELTGLGTGFQRMKQLSIIMAIISSKIGNKRFDYPFISDAPFSEFGDNFINNFFKIAPNVFTQSIIFIKELYNPNSENYLNDLGNKILQKMINGEIPGTFYVNVIEERADTTNLVTKNKCYKG